MCVSHRSTPASPKTHLNQRSKAAQAIYALRKTVVEPLLGQNKGVRRLERFRLRGLEKVNGEWALTATAHNLLKLFR